MQLKRVVVTGLGALTPIAVTYPYPYNSAKRSKIKFLEEIEVSS